MDAGPPSAGDEQLVARLRSAGCVFAEDEAAILLTTARNDAHLDELVRRRVAGDPLEHLVGHAMFDGLRIPVGPGVFVPRQRSVLVVEQALGLLQDVRTPGAVPGRVLVDVCCGSGALGYAVLRAAECEVDVHACDLDPVCVGYAARLLGPTRVFVGDLLDALPRRLRGRVDLVVASPPYVPTGALGSLPPEARLHEPVSALDGGADGLLFHRRLAATATDWLTAGGSLVVEIGTPQIDDARRLFTDAGFDTDVVHDAEREATAVIATQTAELADS